MERLRQTHGPNETLEAATVEAAKENDDQQIDQKERASAALKSPARKLPDVAQPDRRACRSKDKANLASPLCACLFHQNRSLSVLDTRIVSGKPGKCQKINTAPSRAGYLYAKKNDLARNTPSRSFCATNCRQYPSCRIYPVQQDDFYHLMNGKFCGEAWDAISRYVYTALQGGSIMKGWTNDDRMMITCCNDGTRPVIFRIERIDIPENDEEAEWLAKQNFKNTAEDAYTG